MRLVVFPDGFVNRLLKNMLTLYDKKQRSGRHKAAQRENEESSVFDQPSKHRRQQAHAHQYEYFYADILHKFAPQ
jgi:hypothetical protein